MPNIYDIFKKNIIHVLLSQRAQILSPSSADALLLLQNKNKLILSIMLILFVDLHFLIKFKTFLAINCSSMLF